MHADAWHDDAWEHHVKVNGKTVDLMDLPMPRLVLAANAVLRQATFMREAGWSTGPIAQKSFISCMRIYQRMGLVEWNGIEWHVVPTEARWFLE